MARIEKGPYRSSERSGPWAMIRSVAPRPTMRWAWAGLLVAGLVIGGADHHVVTFDDGGPALHALCEANAPGSPFDYYQWHRRAAESGFGSWITSDGVDAGVTVYRATGEGSAGKRPWCDVRVRGKTVLGYDAWSHSQGQVHHTHASVQGMLDGGESSHAHESLDPSRNRHP